jgi:hypothetical protein
LDDLEASQ